MLVVFIRRMMSTLQWSRPERQLSDYMLFVGNLAIAVCCAEVLFQSSFVVSLNALLGVLYAERSTKRTTEPDTAQSLSAYSRDLLTPIPG